MKRIFGSVWINILSALFLLMFALNFVISVLPPFSFVITAKVTSLSLLTLSSVILFFIVLFTYRISRKKLNTSRK